MSAVTSARVDLEITNNASWVDAFTFGDATDTSWSFTGQKFRLDVKGNREDTTALLSLTSDAGEIVVDDPVLRALHLNVPDSAIQGALPPHVEYLYDLIMYDTATPPERVQLMHGTVKVLHGITGD